MKKIIIVDLNGTMVDKTYKITIPLEKLNYSINKAKSNGSIIGLSSDSPKETLLAVATDLGIDGPIIAEGGAVLNIGNKDTLLNSNGSALRLCSDAMIEHLVNNRNVSRLVSFGDVNRLSRLLIEHGDIIGANASEAIFINGMRLASMSFFCFQRNGMGWMPNPEQLEYFTNWSLQYLDSNQLLSRKNVIVDQNIDYGISVLHHKDTKKSLAIQPLQTLYPNAKIFIIGDSMFDWHGENAGVTHCAVANASPEYKNLCSYVADKSYTEGVIEIIDTL